MPPQSGVDECPICYEPIDSDLYTTPCRHSFHSDCLDRVRDLNCRAPTQRTQIVSEEFLSNKRCLDQKYKDWHIQHYDEIVR